MTSSAYRGLAPVDERNICPAARNEISPNELALAVRNLRPAEGTAE